MWKLTTVEELEAVVGTQPQAMMMKAIDALDEGSMQVIATSPFAGLGFRDSDGTPWTTIAGGPPGFARVPSPTRVEFDVAANWPVPGVGSAISLVFLVPGIGETLRL